MPVGLGLLRLKWDSWKTRTNATTYKEIRMIRRFLHQTPHHLGLAFALILLASILYVPTVGAAPQHQHANAYVYWQTTAARKDLWNVDQQIWIDRKADHTYWALVWTFTGSDRGGYMGLQTDGTRFDRSVGETAIFSLWDANGARGPACDRFSGEGVGYSCRAAFSIAQGRHYRLRLWILDRDSAGQWWGAWISDGVNDWHIGDIRVPAANHQRVGDLRNFSEYFGPAVPCSQVPRSIVNFTQPAGNLRGQSYEVYSTLGQFQHDTCGNARATPVDYGWTHGATVVLGDRTN